MYDIVDQQPSMAYCYCDSNKFQNMAQVDLNLNRSETGKQFNCQQCPYISLNI